MRGIHTETRDVNEDNPQETNDGNDDLADDTNCTYVYTNLTEKEFDQFYGSDVVGEFERFNEDDVPLSDLGYP